MPEHERPSFRRLNFAGAIPSGLLQLIVVDIVCPYMVYPLLQARLSPLLALLVVMLFPIASIIGSCIKHRMPEPLGIIALYVIVCNLISSFIISVPVEVLYALFIALAGLIVLATQGCNVPVADYVERYMHVLTADPEAPEEEQPDRGPQSTYRQDMRKINGVWGIGQCGLALILGGVILLVSHEESQDLLQYLVPLTIAIGYIALIVWTIQYRSSHLPSWQATSS